MRIGILTISDLGAVGQRTDTSGDAILDWATERGYDVVVRSIVAWRGILASTIACCAWAVPGTEDITTLRGLSLGISEKSGGRLLLANVQGPSRPADKNQRPDVR